MAYLNAINSVTQTVVADGYLVYDTKAVSGCSSCCSQGILFTAGSNTITLRKAGTYLVTVNANVTPTAAGDISLRLVKNGVAVPGASATATGVVATTFPASFTTLITVLPSCKAINNVASLQVQLTAAGTVTSTSFTAVKIA